MSHWSEISQWHTLWSVGFIHWAGSSVGYFFFFFWQLSSFHFGRLSNDLVFFIPPFYLSFSGTLFRQMLDILVQSSNFFIKRQSAPFFGRLSWFQLSTFLLNFYFCSHLFHFPRARFSSLSDPFFVVFCSFSNRCIIFCNLSRYVNDFLAKVLYFLYSLFPFSLLLFILVSIFHVGGFSEITEILLLSVHI